MNPIKILLVDDSKSARYALRLQLQRHGVEVETADSAESALERVKQAPPDAVFMDHTMPGMNGFEALEIIKADPTTAHIPVVMCTSHEEPEFMAQARRKGALDILAKSATPEKLADLLGRLQEALGATAAPAAAASPLAPPPSAATEAAPTALSSVREVASDTARQEVERVLADQLEQRLQALMEPRIKELADQLARDMAARNEKALAERLESEIARMQRQLIRSQTEQAQATADRLLSDSLPKMVQQQLEESLPSLVRQQLVHEETRIAQMVQELIDGTVDRLPEDQAFLRRMHRGEAVSAANNSHETVRRHAREVAEETASGHSVALSENLRKATSAGRRLSYLLAAGSALIGIAAAAVVYFLPH
jgi:CheY-like chemotaxis protein